MQQFLKYFAYLMVVLFVWAAYVQLNDPDAGMWVAVYLFAAVGSLVFALGRLPAWLALILALAFLAGAVVFWPESYEGIRFGERGMANMNIELGRESLGLGITALIFFLYSWKSRGRRIA